jgi:hypothetical protein
VLDVDEAEADKILLTHDPLAGMAEVSRDHLNALLAEVHTESTAVRDLLEELTKQHSSDAAINGLPPDRDEVNIPESYQVVVECRDEDDQRDLFERMRKEGYRCRVLTL